MEQYLNNVLLFLSFITGVKWLEICLQCAKNDKRVEEPFCCDIHLFVNQFRFNFKLGDVSRSCTHISLRVLSAS